MTIPLIRIASLLVVAGVVTWIVAGWRRVRAVRRMRRPVAVRDVVAATLPVAASGEAPAGRQVIAVIGIDHYADWPRLHNAVGDARGALQLFQRRGFALARRRDGSEVVPLLDHAATSDAIQQLVTADLGKLEGADSLIVFFAGHGHTTVREFSDGCVVTTGYIIPVDGGPQADGPRRWLRLDALLSDIARLPPRHILVVIDACSSGVALQSLPSLVQLRNGPTRGLRDRRSRRIITSAHHDQSAQDNGPVPGHSVFTGCLITGFETGAIARGARHVSGSEIGLYLQKQVGAHTRDAQTPDFGAFELDGRGDLMVDVAPEASAARVEPTVSSEPSATPRAWRADAAAGLAGLAALLAGVYLLSRGDAPVGHAVVVAASGRAIEPPASAAPLLRDRPGGPAVRDPEVIASGTGKPRAGEPRTSAPVTSEPQVRDLHTGNQSANDLPASDASRQRATGTASLVSTISRTTAAPPSASATSPDLDAMACRAAHDSILASNPFVAIGDAVALQMHEISEQEWYARDSCRPVQPGPRIAKAHITQVQAQAFCRALGGELPSPEIWLAAYKCAGARDAGRCAIENLADGVEELTARTDESSPENPMVYVIGGSSVLVRSPTRLRRIPAGHTGPVTGARCTRRQR